MIRDDATEAQVRASDPTASTWLGANAGSGKTRVLTDRVSLLLLRNVRPENILCLTFTKAAASEMQNRLFRRLGGWAMLADDDLRRELLALNDFDEDLTPEFLSRARTLFARAIETPGGLRIQTIHAFCASLLRRFPLEAGVSPQFQEIDDRAAQLLRRSVLDRMADGADATLISQIALLAPANPLEELAEKVVTHRTAFDRPMNRESFLAFYDLSPDTNMDAILSDVFLGGDIDFLKGLVPFLQEGGKTDLALAKTLERLSAPDTQSLAALENVFLYKSRDKQGVAKIGSVPTKGIQKGPIAPHMERLENLMRRVESARPRRLALRAAERDTVLHAFASAFLQHYEEAKTARGWLDFDDLILRTRDLLSDRSVAEWVLYRLDGGIDHILVDEAQDTSPEQWDVIEKLAQEFTSGEGARTSVRRTIFVVGDKKQSIYSFQGADPREFDRMREVFRTRLATTEAPLVDSQLNYSFRSSEPILRLVDQVFDGHEEAGFVPGQTHLAFHDRLPGRVDLWPAVPKAEKESDQTDWSDPVDRVGSRHHDVILAQRIARFISETVTSGTRLPDHIDDTGTLVTRATQPGDFLILVRRRSRLFREILRACKALKLPIAGADRLRVMEELAVRDLRALLSFLATPEDDLSLACALRSPLFGLDEQAIFDLAHKRTGRYLWEELRRQKDRFDAVLDVLQDLRGKIDFLRPFDLLERILVHHGGRRRLIGRLGAEAEDGIDALLDQALSYEQTEVPSLTGFLHWLDTDDLEIKRSADVSGNRIRVMTVHGAKGLEAPIVILPDTGKQAGNHSETFLETAGTAVWRLPGAEQPPQQVLAETRQKAARQQEADRLLYVALTRAERWLVVAAAGDLGTDGQGWHDRVRAGLEKCGAKTFDFGFDDHGSEPGLRYSNTDWPASGTAASQPASSQVDVPAYLTRPAPPPPQPPRILRPSTDLGGAKALAGAEGDTEEEAKRRGTLIHLLLEHLPSLAPELRAARARDLLKHLALGEVDNEALVTEALAVLDAPELAPWFAPGAMAEVSLTGPAPGFGNSVFHATVDRLIVSADKVRALDFKTNRVVPDSAEACPEGLLRQMGAYSVLLEQIYPGRTIETGILWTKTARFMPLPRALITDALEWASHLDAPAPGP